MKPKLKDLHSGKKLQVIEKTFLEKNLFQFICADEIFKTICGNFLKINRSRYIELLVVSWFRKIVFHNKVINKTRKTKKIKKIPHSILEEIISQIILANFYKVGLNPEELQLLR